jgi:hypothetical protein
VDVHGQAIDDLVEITMLYAQLTQLLDVAEQLAIDIVFDFHHRPGSPRSPIVGWLNGRYDTPMSSAALEKLDWDHIDTVLLDLDGTLLDLGFDNDFWLDFIPSVYAASQAMTLEQAKAVLTPRFRACEGTMSWYCIDYWSRELGLNVEALKRTQAISAARGGQARPARDYGDIPAVESVSDLDPGLPWTDGRHGAEAGAGQDPVLSALPSVEGVDDSHIRQEARR